MHILVGLCLGLVLLYYWLLGHWFARVVTLILFVPLFALGGAALFGSIATTAQPPPGLVILGALIGAALAWPVSSIPIYWLRSKAP